MFQYLQFKKNHICIYFQTSQIWENLSTNCAANVMIAQRMVGFGILLFLGIALNTKPMILAMTKPFNCKIPNVMPKLLQEQSGMP